MMKNDHYLLSSGMHSQQYQVFINKSLDGAVSLLTFLWSKPKSIISFKEIGSSELIVAKDQLKHTLNTPDVYFLGLALNNNFLPELDEPYITIIDHHKGSDKHINNFKNCKTLCKEYSSSSLLVRKLYSETSPELTEKQKKLILLADDYESFKFDFKESFDLNLWFWSQYKNNFAKFIKDYKEGFTPFTENQKNQIDQIKTQLVNESKKLQKFAGFLEIKGDKKHTLGVLSDNFNGLIFNSIIQNSQYDLYFFINPKTEKVVIKQKRSNNLIDISKFAEKFCEGYGYSYTAGGKLTPLFMELTKNLKPL